MGVLGLTPFLQKHCPSIIKVLPDRFESLRGKTVAIDGTLVTQRLHFAPAGHPHRHILGWYRLITELRSVGIDAICVFDGAERNRAKLHEIAKRKELRRVLGVRGSLEVQRLRRLQQLSQICSSYSRFPKDEWKLAQQKLLSLMREERLLKEVVLSPQTLQNHIYDGDDLYELEGIPISGYLEDVSDLSHTPPRDTFADEFVLKREACETTRPRSASRTESINLATVPIYVTGELDLESQPVYFGPQERISTILVELYLSFIGTRSSLLAQRTPTTTSFVRKESENFIDLEEEEHPEVAVTKIQYLLTLEESKFWDRLAESAHHLDDKTLSELNGIARRSQHISETYVRRSSGPTNATYDESRVILSAMGITCINCSGPYEAEALAASLVIHGHASFVASEDTDVLIYGVPLIRNATNRKNPLVSISGEDVRNALQLNHESYVDFALLLGTDFTRRIHKIGPSKALKLIREYGTIERIVEQERLFALPTTQAAYLEQVGLAREIFRTIPKLPTQLYCPRRGLDDPKLVAELMTSFGLSRWLDKADVGWELETSRFGSYFNDSPTF